MNPGRYTRPSPRIAATGVLVLAMLCIPATVMSQGLASPLPGETYKEFTRVMGFVNDEWRVTDPNSTFQGSPGNSPSTFLPNPQLPITINDLTGAVRAEAVIDMWGGHVGTTVKKLRFNSNSWIALPELSTPPTSGQCYTQQFNHVVNVPLSHLVWGTNILEGTSGNQTCYSFNWGQWGWYMATVRVYYNSSQPHPTGSITSPLSGSSFGENPTITVNASGGAGVQRVELLAYYDGYDTDGDGVFQQYHHSYQRPIVASTMEIANHIGTATTAPYQLIWDTEWVPDQVPGGIKLIARIRDHNGVWFVTDEITGLTLNRSTSSVKIYKPTNVPENFWVRAGQTKSCNFTIPASYDLAYATAARLAVRTWNGVDGQAETGQSHYTRVNGWYAPTYGSDHFFSYDTLDLPVSALSTGSNSVTFHSQSSHHGIEILWPGPAVLVRYENLVVPQPPATPIGVSATAVSNSQIVVHWTASPEPDVTGYRLYRSTTPGVSIDPAHLVAAGITSTSYTNSWLAEWMQYYYRVIAVNDAGLWSPASSEVNATTLPDSTPPSIVSARPLDAVTVEVTFSETVDLTTAELTSNYHLTSSAGVVTIHAATLGTSRVTVTLSTGTLTESVPHTLTVTGVLDDSPVPNAANDSVMILFENALVAHWQFDEGVGTTAADASGLGHDGLLIGPNWTPGSVDGSSHALTFDGTGDHVDVDSMDVSGDGLTIAAWFRADSFTVVDGRIISKATATAGSSHYYMLSTIYDATNDQYRLRFRVRAGGITSLLIADGGALEAGVWTHAAATYDGTVMRIYKDGSMVGSTPKTGSLATNAGVFTAIGNQPVGAGDRPFHGLIDDVRLYSRALSSAEIASLATPPACIPPMILGSPTAVVACEGLAALLSVTASGVDVQYQWRRDGLDLPGATDSTLDLTPVQTLDAASYDVVVTNPCGSVVSDPALLTVILAAVCDCNGNAVLDDVEVSDGLVPDCNGNGIPDSCDLVTGASVDVDLNGIPDECAVEFVRGDCDLDASFAVTDAVFLLEYLFQRGNLIGCEDACDTTDDGVLDLVDAIGILWGLFGSPAMPPPPPFPFCGPDPTKSDPLGCIGPACP